MSLASKLNYLIETKNLIKNALINKGQTVSDSDTFRSYADKIANIETGVDTSDATASAADILNGATAYVNNEKVTGTATSTSATVLTKASVTAKGYTGSVGDVGGRTVTLNTTNDSAYIEPNASITMQGVAEKNSYVITKFIMNIQITGEYATSQYYDQDFKAQVAYLSNTDCVLMMRGGTSSAYENIGLSINLGNAPGNITADEMEMTMYDSTNGSTGRLYAAIIRNFEIDKLYNISIDMCEIDSSVDCVFCEVVITETS